MGTLHEFSLLMSQPIPCKHTSPDELKKVSFISLKPAMRPLAHVLEHPHPERSCGLVQKCEIVLSYCLSDIDGRNEAHFTKLTGLPLIAMADDSIATLASLTDGSAGLDSLYVMGSREAAILSALSHRIITWNVSLPATTKIAGVLFTSEA